MRTILMTDVVNMFGFVPPRILPDHSILSATFTTSYYEFGKNLENNKYPESAPKQNSKKRKNLSKINEAFFMSEQTLNLVLSTINKLETRVNNKHEIDQLWLEIKIYF